MIIGRAINQANPSATDFWASIQLGQTYPEIADTYRVQRSTMDALGMTSLPQYEALRCAMQHQYEMSYYVSETQDQNGSDRLPLTNARRSRKRRRVTPGA
jgi:hypothetical protein